MTTETTWRLDGQTAIITGAAGLIGSALSAGFAANGAHVVMVDRDSDGLARLAAELGGSVTTVECDVTDLDAIDEMARDVIRRFGAVDVLVNNAGGNRRVLPHEVTLADWRHVSDLNLMSCFFVSQRIGLQMIAQRRGSIVNISSTCGCSAMGRGNIVFSAAKAGINHLTRELALEWGASGIRVNAIAPSQVDSAGMRQWMGEAGADGRLMGDTLLGGVPLGRLVRAEDIVGPALFLASDAARMVTGTVIPVERRQSQRQPFRNRRPPHHGGVRRASEVAGERHLAYGSFEGEGSMVKSADELWQEIDGYAVRPGTVALWWLYQAGVVCKTPGGVVAVIDPYLSDAVTRSYGSRRNVPPPLDPGQVRADALLASHSHEDHLDPDSITAFMSHEQDALHRPAAGCGQGPRHRRPGGSVNGGAARGCRPDRRPRCARGACPSCIRSGADTRCRWLCAGMRRRQRASQRGH